MAIPSIFKPRVPVILKNPNLPIGDNNSASVTQNYVDLVNETTLEIEDNGLDGTDFYNSATYELSVIASQYIAEETASLVDYLYSSTTAYAFQIGIDFLGEILERSGHNQLSNYFGTEHSELNDLDFGNSWYENVAEAAIQSITDVTIGAALDIDNYIESFDNLITDGDFNSDNLESLFGGGSSTINNPSRNEGFYMITGTGNKDFLDVNQVVSAGFRSSHLGAKYRVKGKEGKDYLANGHEAYGGKGQDYIKNFDKAWGGDDDAADFIKGVRIAYGQGGNDYLQGISGKGYGGDGNDLIIGSQSDGNTQGHGGNGDDVIINFTHGVGGSGNDYIIANTQANSHLTGSYGDDYLEGRGKDDRLYGGQGDDILNPGGGDNFIDGGEDHDILIISKDAQSFSFEQLTGDSDGYEYRIEIEGQSKTHSNLFKNIEAITIQGGDRDNIVTATGFTYSVTIEGGGGNDTLRGGGNDDIIFGGKGHDVLNGNNGHDILVGSSGDDLFKGGAGNDQFTFITYNSGDIDTIDDFNDADIINIDASSYGISSLGQISYHNSSDGATLNVNNQQDIFLKNVTVDASWIESNVNLILNK